MNKIFLGLSSLLGLQVLLMIALYWGSQSAAHQQAPQTLVDIQQEDIDKIVIQADSANEKASITLQKEGEQWLLPALNNLPVKQQQLGTVLNKLTSLQSNWPIGTTKSSHQRFEVADEKFQRRITLYNGDQTAVDLLLGSSPGFRKVHARLANKDEVYSIAMNTFDFPIEDKQWLDKSLLAVSNISRIQGADYTLKKTGNNWSLENTPIIYANTVDQEKARQLSQKLTSLDVLDIADTTIDLQSEASITIDVVGDQQWNYQWLEKEGKYYVKRSNIDQLFTVSQNDFQGIATVKLADLLTAPKEGSAQEDKSDKTTIDGILSSESVSDLLIEKPPLNKP